MGQRGHGTSRGFYLFFMEKEIINRFYFILFYVFICLNTTELYQQLTEQSV